MPPPPPPPPGWADARQLRIAGAALYAAGAAAAAALALRAASPGLLTPLGVPRAVLAALHVRSLWWTLVVATAAAAPAALHAAGARATPVGGTLRAPAGLPPAAAPFAGVVLSLVARARGGGVRMAIAWPAVAAAAGAVIVRAAAAVRGVAPAPWAGHYGATVGVLYAVHAMYRNDDVVSFPPIQRRRPYAVKAAALACLPSAVRLAGAALAVSAAATRAAPLAVSTHGLAPTAAALLGGLLAAIVLTAGGATVRCVLGERIAFAGGDAGDAAPLHPRSPPTDALLAALAAGAADPLLDVAARHDLTCVAEATDAAGMARRRALFDSGSGRGGAAADARGWCDPVALCLDEVDAAIATAAAGLPGGAKPAAAPPPRWGAPPVQPASAPPSSSSAAAATTAAAALLPRWTHAALALRALGGLAAASARDDALGTAQLVADPNLGAVLAALAGAARTLRSLAAVAPPPAARIAPFGLPAGVSARAGGGDAAVCALADVAETAARRAVAAFGRDAARALATASRWPPAVGKAEVMAEVEAMVDG